MCNKRRIIVGRDDHGLLTRCLLLALGGHYQSYPRLSVIGVTADNVGFWSAIICPLITQSGHKLAFNYPLQKDRLAVRCSKDPSVEGPTIVRVCELWCRRTSPPYRICHYLEDGPCGSKRLFGKLTPRAAMSAKKRGRIPVASKWPSTELFGPLPVRTNL
jgi:hypothetical protein